MAALAAGRNIHETGGADQGVLDAALAAVWEEDDAAKLRVIDGSQ